jgi:hypothetical protein
MDPLIGNGVDPGLLRIVDKRGQERDRDLPRRRPPTPATTEEGGDRGQKEKDGEDAEADSPKHQFDDLA